jgi:hypothetical protein
MEAANPSAGFEEVVVRRALPVIVVASGALVVLLVLAAVVLYRATHGAPQFYEQALAVPRDQSQAASEEFLQQVTTLASDVQTSDHWHTALSEEQINGWLAIDVPTNYPDTLPSELSEPRVKIRDNEATIACRLKTASMDTVVSLTVDVYVSRPNEVAIRFRRASVGQLAVPLGQILHHIESAAGSLSVPTVWRQQEGDPVVVLMLHESESVDDGKSVLQAIELREGVLLLAGGQHSPVIRTAKRTKPEIKTD